ncbi:ribosomal-processing cysteine protease Prp [Lachnospiraceae bacterium LCP25S3_G4]
MIKVKILKNEKHECVGFKAKGHAGASVEGQDIVCAAASVLMINTINSIDKYAPDESTMISDDEEGHIEFKLKDAPSKEATLLLKSMILGLEEMENDENYTKYIDVDFEEV